MFGITPGLTFDNATTVGDMRLLIRQTKEYAERLEKRMQDTEIETVQKFANMQFELAQAQLKGNSEKHDRFELIDAKLMAPSKLTAPRSTNIATGRKGPELTATPRRLGSEKFLKRARSRRS